MLLVCSFSYDVVSVKGRLIIYTMSRKIAVLGGGISGLAAAWNLVRCRVPAQVVLYEGSHRVGGWLESSVSPGGGIQELGPRSIRVVKSEVSSWTTLDMVGCSRSMWIG